MHLFKSGLVFGQPCSHTVFLANVLDRASLMMLWMSD